MDIILNILTVLCWIGMVLSLLTMVGALMSYCGGVAFFSILFAAFFAYCTVSLGSRPTDNTRILIGHPYTYNDDGAFVVPSKSIVIYPEGISHIGDDGLVRRVKMSRREIKLVYKHYNDRHTQISPSVIDETSVDPTTL